MLKRIAVKIASENFTQLALPAFTKNNLSVRAFIRETIRADNLKKNRAHDFGADLYNGEAVDEAIQKIAVAVCKTTEDQASGLYCKIRKAAKTRAKSFNFKDS